MSAYSNFNSIQASSENTTLPNHSIDIITAATAFHWFDRAKAKVEFQRILKPGGWVVLLWNLRISSAPLMSDYESLHQEFSVDYKKVRAERVNDQFISEFFQPNPVEIIALPNSQMLDFEGFKGRILSTSYALKPNDSRFNEMLGQARIIFERHQKNGTVTFEYETKISLGQL